MQRFVHDKRELSNLHRKPNSKRKNLNAGGAYIGDWYCENKQEVAFSVLSYWDGLPYNMFADKSSGSVPFQKS